MSESSFSSKHGMSNNQAQDVLHDELEIQSHSQSQSQIQSHAHSYTQVQQPDDSVDSCKRSSDASVDNTAKTKRESGEAEVKGHAKSCVWLRQATVADIEALEALLNLCYRSDAGWTNEAELIGGIRTTAGELRKIIESPTQYLFVYPERLAYSEAQDGEAGNDALRNDALREAMAEPQETGRLLASISVEAQAKQEPEGDDKQGEQERTAYIGMFAVHPELQGQGVGHVILQAAETFAVRHFGHAGHCRLTMSILAHRPELLAYYERRGYQLTGKRLPFPNDGNNGEPLRDDLELLELEKQAKSMSLPDE